jgi:hypothetical protein
VHCFLKITYKFACKLLNNLTMKKLIAFLFLFGMMGGASLTAQSTHTTRSTTSEKVVIRETSSMKKVLKSTLSPAIEAWLTDGQLDILFQGNLGSVVITVTGTQGDVYQTSVLAADGTEITISTQDWEAGSYTITIVRSNGQTFAGDFELIE